MTVGGFRPERIAEEIRNEVMLMLAGELKDPRLAVPLIVTEVRVAPGMRTVRVFIQLEGDKKERHHIDELLRKVSHPEKS